MFNSRKEWGRQLREEAPWPPAPRKYFPVGPADQSGPEGSAGLLPRQLPAGAPLLPLPACWLCSPGVWGAKKQGPTCTCAVLPLPEKDV